MHPWLTAIGSLVLVSACGPSMSNAPETKTASEESAAGSDESASGDKVKESSKNDMAEEDETDEVTTPSKSNSGEAKEKPAKGAAPVDDSRTTETIHKIIKEHRTTFKKCYETERAKAPDLKGSVVLELTLDGDGKIKSVGTNAEESTIKVKAITDCIVKVAQGLTYPASSKGLDKDFRYEFGFNNK